jgi:hypothetical protein
MEELTILYTKVREGRYLRTLELSHGKILPSSLNFEFIEAKDKEQIKKDVEVIVLY